MAKRNRIIIKGFDGERNVVTINGVEVPNDMVEVVNGVNCDGTVEVVIHVSGNLEIADSADVDFI